MLHRETSSVGLLWKGRTLELLLYRTANVSWRIEYRVDCVLRRLERGVRGGVVGVGIKAGVYMNRSEI